MAGLTPSMVVQVGELELPNPVMTAAGTAGYADELASFVDLARLGAVVVKSQSPRPWPGNPGPRVHETPAGMINSVGLQGPGVKAWIEEQLPALLATGVERVVASIWGHAADEFGEAAELMAGAPPEVVAVEVNLSCPNRQNQDKMFGQSPDATCEVLAATAVAGRPRWAKLTYQVTDLTEIAAAAVEGGASALTLINTLPAMVIDTETRRPRLGAGRGGLSGPAIRPLAVRAIYDCRAVFPDLPIVGVGGVATGADAAELMLAGANAVQVGTAGFADPRAVESVLDGLEQWCRGHGVVDVGELSGGAHGGQRSER
ncbi:MAG: Dihydroorotate dehydrogenase B (NAD(+)), catalytic subunit [Acidimicrobiales bacterium]|nr:MAG: dihydroorotate dehydrogenase [Actinomycetota bacterium]MBV6507076.1 Dihydroorotate dehydrogenase B (NAD(+)), catalytic subunit [Acidimicrobiales bacterium]RIK05617.1 MAG: dihydroorotate dehydrogenase [Acidobacteriota bacterium]